MSAKINYLTAPQYLDGITCTYTPTLEKTEFGDIHLTLSISHLEIMGKVLSDSVEVTLLNTKGETFTLYNKSTNELTQVGGSISVTSNLEVDFRTNSNDKTPSELKITHKGESFLFQVVSKTK